MIARIPPGHPAWPATFPEGLSLLRTELETFYRELPRLLEEGEEGRYVVIKGADCGGAWDTLRDALQYGYARFGAEPFLTQEIDGRYLDAMSGWFAPPQAARGGG